LEAQKDKVCHAADSVVYRIWRLYLSGSAHGFRTGQINVYQTLLTKTDQGKSGLPLTRADWYNSRTKL
jgi:cyclopropane-fatty-acyl-phospholipid synthase